MFKKTNSFRAFGAAIVAAGSIALSLPATAQVSSLSEVLRRVEADSNQLDAEGRERVAQFQRERDAQASAMASARAELRAAEARGARLNSRFEANEARLAELSADLNEQAGDFGELLGQFRTAAGETMPIINSSLSNFQYPGRTEKLSEVAQARTLPTRRDLDSLPKSILREMIAQSEVTSFTAPVAGAGSNGETLDVELTRVGVFTAATSDGARFVEVISDNTATPYVRVLKAQPSGKFRSAMRSLIRADEGATIIVPFDPSKGDLFAIEGEKPSLQERIGQGGAVGAVILTLLAVGLVFAVFKIFTLFLMGGAMARTAKSRKAGVGNPLARVLEAYETNKGADLEALELKLDEQILRESPKIERFNDVIKVLAAVAPLLGLLGTVIGMIITFTAITNFGAGDPKLMAGGISTALMTTVLGLVAAIPLLLLHAISASMARGNQQVLDEQAAGLVAERAERGGAA
ncbi:MAG: Biopolymer transport protein ExbB [Hyphomonas sp. TMED17]|nr:MAG: biopolymer transporter ExbB [Hyphomonas sp. TMED17]CAI8325998.1 MAG: Biopolymer transport protein ExbB [Hyphomonas sp. TMED17]